MLVRAVFLEIFDRGFHCSLDIVIEVTAGINLVQQIGILVAHMGMQGCLTSNALPPAAIASTSQQRLRRRATRSP